MQPEISSHQLKRFVRHLCVVSSHLYEREDARKKLDSHINKIKKSPELDKEISLLNKKINLLLEKETKVAELGLRKSADPEILKKVQFLEEQLKLLQDERDRLTNENEQLKSALDSIEELKDSLEKAGGQKTEADERVQQLERSADKKYRDFFLNEIAGKIAMLQENYKRISKDKSIHPARLEKIRKKLEQYKEKLKQIKSS